MFQVFQIMLRLIIYICVHIKNGNSRAKEREGGEEREMKRVRERIKRVGRRRGIRSKEEEKEEREKQK